jgi:hypothetical protein
MASGRDTLASLDAQLQQLRQETQTLDAHVQATSKRVVELRQAQGLHYRRLAELRLAALQRGPLLQGLDAADRQVQGILAEREAALAELRQASEQSQRRQAELERERQRQADRVAEAEEAIDAQQAATQHRLADDPDYRARLEGARAADAVARQAEEKASRAETDRREKGRSYEADRRFMYLWARGYGTSGYRAAAPIRLLDGWLARRIRYQDGRPNYAMLLEIPKRLTAHAQVQRRAADAAAEALRALEQTALVEDGGPELRATLEREHARLAGVDQDILAEEQVFRDLLARQATFATGTDEYNVRAIEVLVAEIQGQGLESLRREAMATPGPEDDTVVRDIALGEEETRRLEAAIGDQRAVYEGVLERLRELEEVRRRFKEHRFDASHSDFPDQGMLGVLLAEFVRGLLSSGQLWREIERQQRTRRPRSNPSFGSGGLLRGGGPWGGGGGGGRGGGWGGGGGDGFRTGGGF